MDNLQGGDINRLSRGMFYVNLRLKMKKYIWYISLTLLLAIILSFKPTVLFIAKRQLSKAFPGSSVSIGSCSFKRDFSFSLGQIKIQKSHSYDIEIGESSLKYPHIDIKDANLRTYLNSGAVELQDIQGKARLDGRRLSLDSVSAKIFDGTVEGNGSVFLDNRLEYSLNIRYRGIDIDSLVNDLNLKEKFTMSGELNGSTLLKGNNLDLQIINGDISAVEPGGVLTINDTGFLENLAQSSQQPLDILREGFKEYQYNTGIIKLYLQEGSLVLDISLNGDSGRRDLMVTLHNFKSK